MILTLSLEDWKSHSKSEFTFGKGTNVLVGRMGSGKSSVLDALCFALYGTFPKMSRRDQTVEDLVNSTSGADAARVRLEFEKGGRKYSVMRRAGKKAAEAEVKCDGKLAQKGPKAVTEYVNGILGVDYELFTRAIYSEQNRIDYLLTLKPKERKTEIDWLLGLGQFDEAREAAQSAYGKLSEAARSYAEEADRQKMEELHAKAEEQEKTVEERKQKQSALKQQLEQLSKQVTHTAQEMLVLEKLRAAYQKKKTECDMLSGSHARLKKEAGGKEKPSKEALEALTQAHGRAQQEVLAAKSAVLALQSEVSSLKSEIAILENGKKLAEGRARKAEELEGKARTILSGKAVSELDTSAQKLKEENEGLSTLHSQLHAEIAQLSSAVETLSSAHSKCPVCDADLSEGKAESIGRGKRALLEEKQVQLSSSGKELKEKKARMASLEKSIYDLSLYGAELARLKAEGIDVLQFGEEIERKKAAKQGKEREMPPTQKQSEKAEEALGKARSSLEEAQRAGKLFSELEETERSLAAAQDELSKTDFSESAYDAKRKNYEELRLQAAKLEAENAGAASQIGLMEELVRSIRKEIGFLQEKEKLASAYGSAAESMALYKNSLSAAQSELRSNLIEEINEALCEVWPAVYPYSDYTGVKIEADEKDYRLLMEKNGAWLEVDAIASGGERACLCLGLRIAFATVLTPDIGVLILDEPTHNLDSDAVLLLSEAINSKIPSIVEQTFVITHDSALGETSEGTVFVLSRDKGRNESTRVEKAG